MTLSLTKVNEKNSSNSAFTMSPTEQEGEHKDKSKGKPLLVAFGNPLLDIVVTLSSDEEEETLVRKHGLVRHVGQEVDSLPQLLLDVADKRKQYVAGGCALNTCRVLRWLDPGGLIDIRFFGSVGEDENRDRLEEIVRDDGIDSCFATKPALPTGHCVALVRGQERTMCASLGAAASFDGRDFDRLRVREDLDHAAAVYVTSFFAVHSWDITLAVAEICSNRRSGSSDHNVSLAFNLNGEYLWQDGTFMRQLSQLLPKVRILFGNRNEFRTLSETAGRYGSDCPILRAVSRAVVTTTTTTAGAASLEDDGDQAIGGGDSGIYCTVVISDGPDPIVCFDVCVESGRISNYEEILVTPIAESDMVDTIGAGDSFVSGYLNALLAGMDRKACIERGMYASCKIIQEVGTRLPKDAPCSLPADVI